MTNDFDKAVEAATIAARKESYFVPDNVLRAIVNAALPPSAAAGATVEAVQAGMVAGKMMGFSVPPSVVGGIINAAIPHLAAYREDTPSAVADGAAEATRELLDQMVDRGPAAIQAAMWMGQQAVVPGARVWAPTPDSDGHLTLDSIVRQAIGAGSVCWETMAGTGQFREDIANSVAEGTLVAIRRLLARGGF